MSLLEAVKPFVAVADRFERRMHDAGFTTRDDDFVGPQWFCGFTFGQLKELQNAAVKLEKQNVTIC